MKNYWDQEEPFVDRPMGDENQVIDFPYAEPPRRNYANPEARVEFTEVESVLEEVMADDDEAEDTTWLTNARLRLEQGRLYEMLMNHNMFDGVQADPQAIKNVQREIRLYAKERMEVMLGMKQQQQKVVTGGFNDLEMQALRLLASKISGGATQAPPKPVAPSREGLAPMAAQKAPAPAAPKPVAKPQVATKPQPAAPAKPLPKTAAKPVERKPNPTLERIAREEGVSVQDLELDYKPLSKDPSQMTEQEKLERNAEISKRRRIQKHSSDARSMPTYDQQMSAYSQQAASVNTGPMSLILNAIANKK